MTVSGPGFCPRRPKPHRVGAMQHPVWSLRLAAFVIFALCNALASYLLYCRPRRQVDLLNVHKCVLIARYGVGNERRPTNAR